MIEACSKQHNNVKTAKPDGRGSRGRGGAGYAGDGRITVELKEQKIQTKIYELKSELK